MTLSVIQSFLSLFVCIEFINISNTIFLCIAKSLQLSHSLCSKTCIRLSFTPDQKYIYYVDIASTCPVLFVITGMRLLLQHLTSFGHGLKSWFSCWWFLQLLKKKCWQKYYPSPWFIVLSPPFLISNSFLYPSSVPLSMPMTIAFPQPSDMICNVCYQSWWIYSTSSEPILIGSWKTVIPNTIYLVFLDGLQLKNKSLFYKVIPSSWD